MNNDTYVALSKLGIFNSKEISEEEYNNCIQNNQDKSIIYIKGYYENVESENTKWFKKVDTKGLSPEDIKLQLTILQTKNLLFIKNAIIFSMLIMIISIISSIFL